MSLKARKKLAVTRSVPSGFLRVSSMALRGCLSGLKIKLGGCLAQLVETPTRILRYPSSKLGDGKKKYSKFCHPPLNISELNFLKCEIEHDEPE